MKRIFKRIMLSVALCTLIASFLCSCAQNEVIPAVTEPTDATESTTTESAAPENTTADDIISENTTAEAAAQTAEGDFEYMNIEVWPDEPGTGEPQCYTDLYQYFECDSDNMNFVKYVIIKKYTPEEACMITADDSFRNGSSLFKAKIVYDYLRGEEVDIEVNIALAGDEKSQVENFPLYAEGGEYISQLGILFMDSWTVAFPELIFVAKEVDGVEYAYHTLFNKIELITPDGVNLDLGISDDERYEYTSTNNNPVLYVHKYKMTELADFIRNDWTNMGYKFTDFSNGANKPGEIETTGIEAEPEEAADTEIAMASE